MFFFSKKNFFSHATLGNFTGTCILCIETDIIFIYKHLLVFRFDFPIFFYDGINVKYRAFQLMFYCVDVADKRKKKQMKKNVINM